MFTTAATPWRDGSHLVDLDASQTLTVCGAAAVSMSTRCTLEARAEWLSCKYCRAYALEANGLGAYVDRIGRWAVV